MIYNPIQVAKKIVSTNLEQVDFAIGLVNSVLNLPNEHVGNSNFQNDCNQCSSNFFWRLVEMTFGLVHATYSLPEWQAVKLTFFALCHCM